MMMKNTRNVARNTDNKAVQPEQLVEVLYQKLGGRWFAFSLINDEVFFGSIREADLNGSKALRARKQSIGSHEA
jgi:hypothetical protein